MSKGKIVFVTNGDPFGGCSNELPTTACTLTGYIVRLKANI